MVAFVSVIGSEEKFNRWAQRSFQLASVPEDKLIPLRGATSIASAYNGALDELASLPAAWTLEAAVLMHDDVEISAPSFRDSVLRLLAPPDVAVVGTVGARRVRSLRWWEGDCFGGVRESRGELRFTAGPADVDVVDGMLLALSPWAVENLRFDEALAAGFHGYDADLCFAARAAGKRVIAQDLGLFHHTKGGYGDQHAWLAADAAWRRKWISRPTARERVRNFGGRLRLRLRPPTPGPYARGEAGEGV